MGAGVALSQSRPAVGAIRVDVAPLRANAGDPTASWVEQELPRQLAQALSGRLTPKGAALIVRDWHRIDEYRVTMEVTFILED